MHLLPEPQPTTLLKPKPGQTYAEAGAESEAARRAAAGTTIMNAEAEAKVKAKMGAKVSDEVGVEGGGIPGAGVPIMTLLPKTTLDYLGDVEGEVQRQGQGRGAGGQGQDPREGEAGRRWKEKEKMKGQRNGGFLSPAPKEKSFLGTIISMPDEGEQNPGSNAGSRSRESPNKSPRADLAAYLDASPSPTRPLPRGAGAGGGSPRHKLGRALVPAAAIPEAWRVRSAGVPEGVPEGVPRSATAVDRRMYAVYDLEHHRATQRQRHQHQQQQQQRRDGEKSLDRRREAEVEVEVEANGRGEMTEEEAPRGLYPGVAMAFARIGVTSREGPAVSAVVGGVGRYAAGGA